MGRRKIEIKAIKDDRNRSVTFLKRKGGLFKKAYELSVLCSVDVAVIIFGQNKKLYEFSSGDIQHTLARYQYYGVPHEHKGPDDFADKGGADDDDDDDDIGGTSPPETVSPPHHGIPIQNQPGYQHMNMRHHEASSSPPMPNGVYHPRMSTPPTNDGSRPSSRTAQHARRQSSNLNPHNQHPHASQSMMQPQNYPYQHPMYQQQQHAATANMHAAPHGSPPIPPHHYTHPPLQQNHVQNMYVDQRRSSVPPSFPGQAQAGQPEHQNHYTPPQQHQRHPYQSPPLPEPQYSMSNPNQPNAYFQPNNVPHQEPPRHMQQAPQFDPQASNQRMKMENNQRPKSVDISQGPQTDPDTNQTQNHFNPPPAPPNRPVRTPSASVISGMTPGSRVNSLQSDAKRPRLTVQIPGEASDGSNITGDSETSPKEVPKTTSNNTATPAKNTSDSGHSSGIVLPAPSPRSASAGAILSAGATGPTNPFARPNIPLPGKHNPTSSTNPNNNSSNLDTYKDTIASPMSALPSRVMAENGFMSSPSSMFPELGGFGSAGNNLASPAVYQPTPIQLHGPSFRDAAPDEKKRKSPESGDVGAAKRAKT